MDPDANIIVGSTLDTDMEGMMRVSVVATGIDASETVSEIPVPRRSMAAPLTQTVTAEEPAPAPAPAPVVAEAPAAPVAAEPAEPTLFQELETPAPVQAPAAAAPQAPEEIYEDEYAASDDLPPPVYRPQVAEFQPQPDVAEDPTESFVAPKAPAAGTPSPEALARLQAAVHKAPAAAARPAAPVAERPAAAPQPEAERPRFGINSLINRMTGHGAEASHQGAPQAALRQQPSVQAGEPQPSENPEQDRIEIPAFLRRQAN